MELSEAKFTNRQVSITARILLAIMTPALTLSIYRAVALDGALGIVAVQFVLWCILMVTCFERVPLGFRSRATLLAGLMLIVATGAMMRNQSFHAGMPLAILAAITLSLSLGPRLKYLTPPVIIGLMGFISVALGYDNAVAVASHSVSLSGTMIAAIFLFSSLRQRAADQARDAIDAKNKLELMTSQGDVGLYELNLEAETFAGNDVWKRWLGFDPAATSIPVEELLGKLSADVVASASQSLATLRDAPIGFQQTLTFDQRHVDGSIHTVRLTERKVKRDGHLYVIGSTVDISAETQAVRRAQDLEVRIDLVSRSGGMGMVEFFPDTKTFTCNAEMAERLGLPASDEERSIDLFYAHQPEEIKAVYQQKTAQQLQSASHTLIDFTHPFYLPSGEKRHYRVSRTSRSLGGRMSFLGLSVDVTEEIDKQRQIEQQLSFIDAQNERLNQALDFARIWLFEENLSTGSGKVLRSQHTHEDEAFLVGPARLAATDEEYRSKITDTLSRTGEAVDFPLNFSDSSRKWVRNMTIDEYTDSSGDTVRVQLSQDITDFREQQLALETAVKALNDKNENQAQMFSIIGHELRTPLSSIKMMEEAMNLRNIGEYGSNICDATDAVLNIVDDLRTVINPDKAHEAQRVADSPFDVLSRTTKSLEGLYEQQGVEVYISSNQLAKSLCQFNAQALRQKITNLTKNAAIHADAEKVWVDLQAQPRGDDQIELTLTVEDNGKGIPEGLREAVFGAFSRGDTRADGTGLGLYITRELAEKLGGTVEYFESEKGGAGFKVDFTLDLHLDVNEQERAEEAIPVALQGKRILFAEDQKTLQLLTSKLLKDAGAEVVVCDNGKQALDAFRAGEFDIVLTDLMMPVMSGDELIRHIRADGFTGQVVALTAAIIGKETDNLLEAGADAVLNKPLDIHAMKRTIAGLEIKDYAV